MEMTNKTKHTITSYMDMNVLEWLKTCYKLMQLRQETIKHIIGLKELKREKGGQVYQWTVVYPHQRLEQDMRSKVRNQTTNPRQVAAKSNGKDQRQRAANWQWQGCFMEKSRKREATRHHKRGSNMFSNFTEYQCRFMSTDQMLAQLDCPTHTIALPFPFVIIPSLTSHRYHQQYY